MLGINEKREPIRAPFIKILKDSLFDLLSGNLSEKEILQEKKDRETASRFEIEWN